MNEPDTWKADWQWIQDPARPDAAKRVIRENPMLTGKGYIVLPEMDAREYEDIEEARDVAAMLAQRTGIAYILVASEIVRPRYDVRSKVTAVGRAIEQGRVAAEKDRKYLADAKAEVEAIAPDDGEKA